MWVTGFLYNEKKIYLFHVGQSQIGCHKGFNLRTFPALAEVTGLFSLIFFVMLVDMTSNILRLLPHQ